LARGARLLALLALLLAAAPARAAAAPPTAAEIVARAKALGVGGEAQKLRSRFLPAVRLFPGGPHVPGATRLGGRPDLARGVSWPTCHGHPLAFLEQVRLSDVGGGSGTLAVFGDLREDDDGVTPIELFSGRVGRCVAVRVSRGALAARATPPKTRTLRDTPVRQRPTLTIPDWEMAEDLLGGANRPDPFFDRWEELFYEAAWGTLGHRLPFRPAHQLLGWSSPVQADVTSYTCKHMRLLTQLDWDERLGFAVGDGGALYIAIRPSDLRARRYDRLCGEFQEG
jgi:hypothetical protein